MSRVIALLPLLVLAACMAPGPQGGLRDPQARISSAVLFDPARFAGEWRVMAAPARACAGARQDWRWRDEDFALSGIDCTGPAPARLSGQALLVGPGARLVARGGYGGGPVWVLWVDQDYRVAALGTPEGGWAAVLARPEAARRADLIDAAREVLRFNGYDPQDLTW
ncbi:lipocalin/fatty acid-binding family protein [Phaeovulum vinaykumarii]|uniref:Apolipoprotein D and lipocalin family protein n=1 Tax=Phaeovulum vinaykumarii TaxID=407234 RepID=A0A1N7KUH9_9RHOB|nr:hypothetical protein [Phaeovulum vinaykumarii]SIS65204.1 apolipoprotein D and lipocalin family protein [Phaeovulum vinaykumarii]SOC01367.1 apolipoprotein D and lipocalin family protein [Phaeovulum vinaykumarii]